MIEWKPIEVLPEQFKDGRRVLLWDGEADVGIWSEFRWFGDAGWNETTEQGPLEGVTHFAEINPPVIDQPMAVVASAD